MDSAQEGFWSHINLKHRTFESQSFDQKSRTLISRDCSKILLLGSTGNGKSATANFLTATSSFQESGELEPCTRCINSMKGQAKLLLGRCRDHVDVYVQFSYLVYDTPGLNEPEPHQELENTEQIIQLLLSIEYLSLILFCIPHGARKDDQFVKSLQYYKKLLPSVFETENWGIVLTKLPGPDFKSPQFNVDAYLKKEADKYSDMFGFRIPNIFFFNHVDAEDDENYMIHNQTTRSQILKTSFLLHDRWLENILFPLPPTVETHRKLFHQRSQQVVENFVGLKAQLLTRDPQLSNLYQRINEIQSQISGILRQIKELQTPLITKPKMNRGTHQVHLFQDYHTITLPEGMHKNKVQVLVDVWNCTIEFEECTDREINFCVKPDVWIRNKNDDGFTWSWKIQFIQPGSVTNADQIHRLKEELTGLKDELRELTSEFDQRLLGQVQLTAEEERVNFHFEVFQTISKDLFRKDQIKPVFQLLKELISSTPPGPSGPSGP